MIRGGQIPISDGVTSLNLLTGSLELIGGTNVTLALSGDTITINATAGGAGIASINTSTVGAQTLVSSNTDILTVATNAGTGETVFSLIAEAYNDAGNTPNTLVSRDAFGEARVDFADSSIGASTIGVNPDTTDTLAYPLFVNNLGPSFQGVRTNSAYQYDPATNTLTVNVAGYATTTDLTSGLATKASTASVALKADLASPTLIGIPTAPTAGPGTSTTQLATTAFVAAVAPSYTNVSASGNYSLTSPDILVTQDTDNSTMKLPDASTTKYNAIYTIYLVGSAQNATITVSTGQYLNNVLNGISSIVATSSGVASFRSNGINYWVQIDDIAALALKANIVSLSHISGCKITWLSTTTIGLGAGSWSAVNGSVMYTQASDAVITPANIGVVNGLDTGTYTANTTYHIYSIAHGTTPSLNGGICSTSFTGPTLPSGYVAYRYQGSFRRSSSLGIIRFVQTGTGTTRKITYTSPLNLTLFVNGGIANVFTAVSMSSFVPPSSRTGRISFTIGDAVTDGSGVSFRETGSVVGLPDNLITYSSGSTPSNAQIGIIDFVCSASQSIDYILLEGGTSGYFSVLSYEYDL